ncbi:hypothetical protein F383_38629 [Gossypium arboreum]|uniref:Uncharacterized protein n=1 Tax=Gossypium arboreum TaxID=29729 RepID=A0A0B0MJV6_GOSAR|nr:hypothetical protein F383_38629 [Gossypium arboreum]
MRCEVRGSACLKTITCMT